MLFQQIFGLSNIDKKMMSLKKACMDLKSSHQTQDPHLKSITRAQYIMILLNKLHHIANKIFLSQINFQITIYDS
ncbi:unnamed protein product [Paramecium sonneborni]|uniref:Uncharacterized protein n=1 Tax=Paramecium sonneborni TaxID=65129 RepID=A0A8S1N761_9CILI|nr:unnamed protein product [Paramecium sonneborni]